MVNATPAQAPAIDTLRRYVQNEREVKPLVVVGSSGSGRGHWIQVILKEFGSVPTWLYDPTERFDASDLDGNVMFPIYDVGTPKWITGRCLILLDDLEKLPYKERSGYIICSFPDPAPADIQTFVEALGCPASIAEGNTTYSDAVHACEAWNAAGVHLSRLPTIRPTWENFVDGGNVPVDDILLGYYAAYRYPPAEDSWNVVLALRRHIPARIYRLAFEAIRMTWPRGVVRFPDILRSKKGERKEKPKPVVIAPPVEKGYDIDWS